MMPTSIIDIPFYVLVADYFLEFILKIGIALLKSMLMFKFITACQIALSDRLFQVIVT